MKIGLFITGHIRHVPFIYENYRQFLDGHDTSVYVATWSTHDINRSTHVVDTSPIPAYDACRDLFGNSLKGIWIGDIQKFLNNESPAEKCSPRILWNDYVDPDKDKLKPLYPWPQRVMDQWYAVKQCYLLSIDDGTYNDFDVVIRIRGDMRFQSKPMSVPFQDVRDGIHVNGYIWWENPQDREHGRLVDGTGLVPYALSDQLAWGTPYWMVKYLTYYDHFAKLWAGKVNSYDGNLLPGDPNSFLFNSEHMMAFYLLKFPFYKKYLDVTSPSSVDMPHYRHGHDVQFVHRPEGIYYVADYYDLFKPVGSY